ncbi:hypothetical protein HanPSC8_Chr15g0644151 [Helianthus annuus]|nr:hypothetical protein HanPSC8_Chr15g0644151 [Helianthus annuus]
MDHRFLVIDRSRTRVPTICVVRLATGLTSTGYPMHSFKHDNDLFMFPKSRLIIVTIKLMFPITSLSWS